MSKRTRFSLRIAAAKKSKSIPPNESTHILDLNDDCLDIVFSYFDPIDFCRVKETCRRFGQLVVGQFRRKFREKHFILNWSESNDTAQRVSQFDLSKFFNGFGKFIRKLSVRNLTEKDATQRWIEIYENCSELKELEIYNCNLELFKPIKRSAEPRKCGHLKISKCYGEDVYFNEIISYFTNFEINSLEIQFVEDDELCGRFLQRKFPQLTRIKFIHCCKKEHFDEFLKLNPQIQMIAALHTLNEYNLNSIAKHSKDLRAISIVNFELQDDETIIQIVELGLMEKLKEVFLVHYTESSIELLVQGNVIDTLGLLNGSFNMDLSRSLCKMTRLKCLVLCRVFDITTDSLKTVMMQTNIRKFFIFWCQNVNFDDIAIIIKYSRTLEYLLFEQIDNVATFDETRFLQLTNARKESCAGFPLELSVGKSDFNQMNSSKIILKNNANLVKLTEIGANLDKNNLHFSCTQ